MNQHWRCLECIPKFFRDDLGAHAVATRHLLRCIVPILGTIATSSAPKLLHDEEAMCILEGDVAVKYRRLTAREVLLTEPPQASLYVEEWTKEDEDAELSEYYAFMVADGGGSDCQRLLEAYSV